MIDDTKELLIPEKGWAAPDTLSRQQINQCLMEIQDIHPLREKAKFFEHVVPFCSCFASGVKKPDFIATVREILLAEMKIKRPESEDDLLQDPFLYLGYGVNAYFRLMMSMFWLFVLVTIFYIPVFGVYMMNPSMALKGLPGYGINQFSLGNIGGANVQCSQQVINAGSMPFSCPKGTKVDCNNIEIGAIAKDVPSKDYCLRKAVHSDPLNQDKNGKLKYIDCSKNLDQAFINKVKKDCPTFDAKNKDLNNARTFKVILQDKKSKNKYYPFKSTITTKVQKQCNQLQTVFVQAPCIVPDKLAKTKIFIGLIASCLGVFVYLYFILHLEYFENVEENLFIDTDIKTVTAGDYTIEFDLLDEQYKKFKDHYLNAQSPLSEMAQFKLFIQDELEDRINRMNDMGYDDSSVISLLDPENKSKKIAQITFAFNNSQVIEWLRERGIAIMYENWDELYSINDQIAENLKQEDAGDGESLLDVLQTPVSVFATFETEEGYRRAAYFEELLEKVKDGEVKDQWITVDDKILLGEEIELQEASEPSDIIWECRYITPETRLSRRIIVWFIIVLLLFISGATIFIMSKRSNQLKLRYPYTDCITTQERYVQSSAMKKQSKKPKFTIQQWTDMSLQEFWFNKNRKLQQKPTQYGTVMQCFCRYEYTLNPKNINKNYTSSQNKKQTGKMCQEYFSDASMSFKFGIAISMVIVVFNLILRMIIIKLIDWIGEDTYSERLSSITNAVFMATFFNTGILLLLVNADATEHPPKFITRYVEGQWYDYVPGWYTTVGYQIVFTMVINVFMPFSALTMSYVLPFINQILDVGLRGKVYDTQKTGMAQFKLAWSGGDYIVHFKFANVLNVYFVTLMYGVGLPILFPLAALNFLNQWFCERIIVVYWMKQPPALDNKLIKNIIRVCKWGPIMYLANGYWMLSNVQMFDNIWQYKDTKAKQMKSEHYVTVKVNHATPMMLMLVISVFIILAQIIFAEQLKKFGFAMSETSIDVDEDLPIFFRSIKLSQADEVVKETENMKDNFGFEYMDPDTVSLLDSTPMPDKAIQGTPWYQVISNYNYQSDFQYIPASVNEREKLIEDGWNAQYQEGDDGEMIERDKKARFEQSDMVMVLLNLSYIPDSVVQQIDFRRHWSERFLQYMKSYKEDFQDTHGIGWEFQTEAMENSYLDWKKSQKLKDKCPHEIAKIEMLGKKKLERNNTIMSNELDLSTNYNMNIN